MTLTGTSLAASAKSGVPIAVRNVSKIFGEADDKPFRALKAVASPVTDVGTAFQDHLLLEFRTAFHHS